MDPLSAFTTTKFLKTGLEALGYRHELLMLGDSSYSRYTSPDGVSWLTSNARITYPFISSSAKSISKDKCLGYALAESEGVTIPFTRPVSQDEDLGILWDEVSSYAPLVVKPGGSTLSRGLTMDITDEETLLGAISDAREFSEEVLVQKQVGGDELRFAVLDGECRAAIARLTARVVGDGKRTAAQLLEEENRDRAAINIPNVTYPQLEAPVINLEGVDMARVPADGEIVLLGRSSMIRGGASAYDVVGKVHPSYKQAAEKLASAFGPGFVAVDMLIEDYTKPLTTDNYAFLEFNMSPNLGVFYGCRDGRQYDILRELVPMIDKALRSAAKPGRAA